jgi:flotillin
MALQLPAVKKLGEEVGLNIGEGLKGLSDSLSAPLPPGRQRNSRDKAGKATRSKNKP